MTLFDRLRRWLFGTDDAASPPTESDTNADPEDSGQPHLDPDNVTQVRSTRDDDPVSRLQNVESDAEDGEEPDA